VFQSSKNNKKMKALIILLACVLVVLAQTPTPPVWPSYFSASVGVFANNGQNSFFRWFYDATLNMDRFDGENIWNGEPYFGTRIFNHVQNIETVVYFQINYAACFSHPINGSIPKPPLNLLNYVAKGIVNFQPVYQWNLNQPGNFSFTYYDNQVTRDPVRIDFANFRSFPVQEVTYIFWEFDATGQDPTLYQLSPIIMQNCNNQTSAHVHHGPLHH